MKKLLILAFTAAIGIYACTEATKPTEEEETGIYNAFCYNGDSTSALCPTLPPEVAIKLMGDYHTDSTPSAQFQPPFDAFSWQTFVALNWPADMYGKPSGNSITDNPDAMRVWEYYKDPMLTFRGVQNSPMILHLKAAEESKVKMLYQDSKIPDDFTTKDASTFAEADGYPLVDQNGNFALFEIKINGVEDSFITNNKLTTVTGIYNYAKQVNYPANGKSFLPISDTIKKPNNPGALEIKAAWRILDPKKDDTTKYYCRRALIYVDSAHTVNHKQMIVSATVGLVGMHIIRNIDRFGQFLIWSTFEHVNNAPDSSSKADTSTRWSFYNPGCPTCPQNVPPAHQAGDNGNYLWSLAPPYAGRYYPQYGTQVTRVYPVFPITEQINSLWQNKLKNTVWANYKLVGTQWQINMSGYEHPTYTPTPAYLANTTMETYMQSSATCIGCHNNAYVTYISGTDTTRISTGFSFLFPFNARPQ